MNQINLSENIIRLRKQRKLTQEEIADHLGVTKASVSKWENGLSLPDILLLPQIASLFDVSVDELIGYIPQLSKEQIQKIYKEKATEFAVKPFEEVIKDVRILTRKYYSCYSFLITVCLLYVNHYVLAPVDQHTKLLDEAQTICNHIIKNCKDANLCNSAVGVKSFLNLMEGKYSEVIESIGDVYESVNIACQNEVLLIQAYLESGDTEHARKSSQLGIYLHVNSIIGTSVQYISANQDNPVLCEEILKRAHALIDAYHIDKVNPNASAQLSYQAAVIFAVNKKYDDALTELENFVENAVEILRTINSPKENDLFFTNYNEWLENYGFGVIVPRDIRTIASSLIPTLSHPAFSEMKSSERFIKIKNRLENEVKHYE